MRSRAAPWSLLGLAVLLALPWLLPQLLPQGQAQFWTASILGRAIVFGIIAMSLTFLATYGGFVSLAQMMIAGIAGYTLAIFVEGAVPRVVGLLGYGVAIPLALLAATAMGILVGAISLRSRDIYLLMITLALGMGVFRFIETNIAWFNGYEGIRNVVGPSLFGLDFRNALVFYHAALGTAALLYFGILYLVKTPFGLVLQGIRDNPRRVAALGYAVGLHRIAAFGVAGFIAGCGGVLSTIYNIGISPGSIGLGATVNILIMSVIGGLGHPIGAFIGSLIFTVLDTFAATIYDRDRFNTLIGLAFLAIVLVSPDGAIGVGARLRRLLTAQPRPASRVCGEVRSRPPSTRTAKEEPP
ncbi:branched-chain amino acid ABC transporter permease [Plastoroseomonas hellenica]|uniref:branched-chain amino acid ABC transporter permease n=1 Tax=Plastoroseomonas hellenica TaxID=2687306 RepID=UPI001BAC2362|nr:branched-chain amino acid ABC transporter permease [Plastoroseomonas hellenica]